MLLFSSYSIGNKGILNNIPRAGNYSLFPRTHCITGVTFDEVNHGQVLTYLPENTRRLPSIVLMLGWRRRRQANINTTLGQRVVFSGMVNNENQV